MPSCISQRSSISTPAYRGLGAQRGQRSPPHAPSPRHGSEASLSRPWAAASLRSGLHVRERRLQNAARAARHCCSMSRRGNCYDNAVMESFFATIKSEEGERFESYAHAKEGLVRLHRSVLYPASPPLHPWLNQPGGVRTTDHSGRITKPSTISDQAQVSISSRFEVLRLAIPLSACLGAKVATPETAGTPCALGCAETLNG